MLLAHLDGQFFRTWTLVLDFERVKVRPGVETCSSAPDGSTVTAGGRKRRRGTGLPVLCLSPAAGEESASGHLGRPPTSWPGGPRFAPSAHYILQQTLDGVHPLEKNMGQKKTWLDMGQRSLKSIQRRKPVAFIHIHGFQKTWCPVL